jgi:hypothetical protein
MNSEKLDFHALSIVIKLALHFDNHDTEWAGGHFIEGMHDIIYCR